MLTHALALSASQFVHKRKSRRIISRMHSTGLELTKLTYTRLEDNLIRHLYVCRMTHCDFCCGLLHVMDTNYFSYVTLCRQYCRIFSLELSIILVYTHNARHAFSKLRTCVEPGRAAAHRGEIPLVYKYIPGTYVLVAVVYSRVVLGHPTYVRCATPWCNQPGITSGRLGGQTFGHSIHN